MMLILVLLWKRQNYILLLSASDNQKISKLLSRGFERIVHWKEYKTNSENKNTTNEYRYFLVSNFVGVNRLFILAYSDQHTSLKRFKNRRYYLSEGIKKNYSVIINTKIFYEQPVDCDIKRRMKKLEKQQQDNVNTTLMNVY